MAEASTSNAILQDLVDGHLETPDVEYKNWLDLSDDVVRANTARHICALANYGGGHLVLGFDDDGSPSEPAPENLSKYSQDTVNGIVDRYLVPPVPCAVHMVTAASGRQHPVVRVPSHGAQPICAKRDGPQVKGRVDGIRKAVHYLRVPGPKSQPIDTPELWREVIRRCVTAERDSLLGSISRLFDQLTDTGAESDIPPFVDAALQDWSAVTAPAWPVDHVANRAVFGFRLLDVGWSEPRTADGRRAARPDQISSFAASDEVNDGLVPFDAGWSGLIRPCVAVFDEVVGLESRRPGVNPNDMAGLWRITTDAKGVDVTVFPEDLPSVRVSVERSGTRQWPPGERMSPRLQIQHVAQRLVFVRLLAEAFQAETRELVLDLSGLAGRVVDELSSPHYSRAYTAAAAGRRVAITLPVSNLGPELPATTAALVGPILRLFDGWDINADYVMAELASRN